MVCCVGVTILLSLTVFLQLVAETMPPTSDAVPLIGRPMLLSKMDGYIMYIVMFHYH